MAANSHSPKSKPSIKKCPNGHYTMQRKCPECGEITATAKPARFSVKDKYAKERRKVLY